MYENLPQLLASLDAAGMLKEAVRSREWHQRVNTGLVQSENRINKGLRAQGYVPRVWPFDGRQMSLPGTDPSISSVFRGAPQTAGPSFSQNAIPNSGPRPGSLLGKGSLVNRLGSRAAQGAKDLWAGGSQYASRGGKMLGGSHKLRNRAGVIGGAALLAAGIPAFLASRKQQEEQALGNFEDQGMAQNPYFFGGGMQSPQYGGEYGGGYELPQPNQAPASTDQYGGYGSPEYSEQEYTNMLQRGLTSIQREQYPQFDKQSASSYSPSAAGVAAPPSAPRVNSPGPGVANIPTIKPGEPPKLPRGLNSPKAPGMSGGGGISGPKAPSAPKIAESNAIYPMLAAAAGGLGGHAVGEKLVQPYLKAQERAQQLKIQNAQATAKILKGAGKTAPATVAAAGALLLAALTAMALQRRKAPQEQRGNGYYPASAYDPTGAGFAPQDRQEFGSY